jgi:hypothetical protein
MDTKAGMEADREKKAEMDMDKEVDEYMDMDVDTDKEADWEMYIYPGAEVDKLGGRRGNGHGGGH